jgi:hypothetical protein
MSRFKGPFRATILFCLFFASALTPAAQADTTYTYTGPQFNFFFGAVCPTNCNIGGSFAVPTPLAANLNNFTLPGGTPFSFSSGPDVADQSNVAPGGITVSTSAAGAIDLWSIDLFNFIDGFYLFSDEGGADYDQFAKFEPNPPCGVKVTGGADDTLTFPFPIGVWTESSSSNSVPEPATISLLIAGIVGLLVFATPKRAHKITLRSHNACRSNQYDI